GDDQAQDHAGEEPPGVPGGGVLFRQVVTAVGALDRVVMDGPPAVGAGHGVVVFVLVIPAHQRPPAATDVGPASNQSSPFEPNSGSVGEAIIGRRADGSPQRLSTLPAGSL